jgi:thioesterase domain-containing protein
MLDTTATVGAAPDSTLVTIRPGAPTKPALFCVHAEAGDVSLYQALAHHLTSDATVLGLCTPPAAVAGEPPSLARIAACHVKTIAAAQPNGPHLIVGECTGGALAYEIARQLRAGGREVALLALIDAFPPGLPRLRVWMPRPVHRLLHRARIVGFHLANLARLDMPGRRAYLAAKSERARAALARKVSGARRGARNGAHNSPPDGSHRGTDRRASSGSPQLAFRNAFAAYTPTPYPGSIVVFRAARMPLGAAVAPDMGWRGLADSVEIETIPGYFTTPISEPGVRVLADRLSAHLARVGAGTGDERLSLEAPTSFTK